MAAKHNRGSLSGYVKRRTSSKLNALSTIDKLQPGSAVKVVRSRDGRYIVSDNIKAGIRSKFDKLPSKKNYVLKAVVSRVTLNGLCFVVDQDQHTYGFMLDRVENYAGEPPEEIGLADGEPVELRLVDGKVISVATSVQRANVNS